MKHIRGVDFPEGGLVVNQTETLEALRTGRGTIIQEAAVTVEPRQLTVTGLPYQVSRDRLLAKIAELARTKKVEGVSNVHDETSAKHGCRIIITAKRGVNTRVLLTNLMKHTPPQIPVRSEHGRPSRRSPPPTRNSRNDPTMGRPPTRSHPP